MPRSDDRFLDKLDLARPVQREISGRVLELWREYQTELRRHGITACAKQLGWQVWLAMGWPPGAGTLPEEQNSPASLP